MSEHTRINHDGEQRLVQVNYWCDKLKKILGQQLLDGEHKTAALESLEVVRSHGKDSIAADFTETYTVEDEAPAEDEEATDGEG